MRSLWLLPCVLLGAVACAEDEPSAAVTCNLESFAGEQAMLTALKANYCNVPGSMGQRKYYRLSAMLPGTSDVVEVDLFDNLGAFKGGVVRTGTFQITGEDAAFSTCGVCVRALGDKGTAEQQEFFAVAGTVEITELGTSGQPISATLSNLRYVPVDNTTREVLASTCEAQVTGVKVSGTVVALGMGGGGGGGGGGGNNCPTVIGD